MFGLINAVDFVACGFQIADDVGDVTVAVGLGRDFQLDIGVPVGGLELIVLQLDDVGPAIGEDLSNAQ